MLAFFRKRRAFAKFDAFDFSSIELNSDNKKKELQFIYHIHIIHNAKIHASDSIELVLLAIESYDRLIKFHLNNSCYCHLKIHKYINILESNLLYDYYS